MRTLTSVGSVVAGVWIFLSVEACSTSHQAVSSKPPIVMRRDSSSTGASVNSWAPGLLPGKWHYLIRDSSVVSINNDTTARVEPIESTAIYTVSVSESNDSLLFRAHVDSLLVNSRISSKSAGDTAKTLNFQGTISRQGELTSSGDTTATTCKGAGVAPSPRVSELLTVLPAHPAHVGDKWSDTVSTITCHGKIPLRQTAVREYELLDLSSCQRGGVKVRRVVSDTFSGSSAESANHLSASGSGTASSLLCLDRSTGALFTSDGQSRLDLTVTTTRGIFPFTQRTSTHIETR
jgi:hypothetical protein